MNMLRAIMIAALLAASAIGCRDATAGRTLPGAVPAVAARGAHVESAPRPLGEEFHRGVNHAHVHSRGHGYGSDVSARELDSLKSLGVNAIAITPFAYQHGVGADRLAGFPESESEKRRGDRSMTSADIAQEIATARRAGIKTTLKPHLWSNDFWDGGQWHGTVNQKSPAEHASWWRSYRAFALHYARLADSAGADMFCIGTELVEMSTRYPGEWRALIADIRSVYRGRLSYAAHWEREFDAIEFWDALDYIGITAYFPLNVSDSASVADLVAAWRPHRERIARLAERTGKPVLFLEAGYRPATGSFREPWLYAGGQSDPTVQTRAYEALFRAFSDQPWWRGVYLWKTFTDPAMAAHYGEDLGFCFRGQPAEGVVRAWYCAR